MSNPAPAGRARTPKLLWVVGVLALLWNGFGAFDYTMTETRNAAYLKAMTPQQLAALESFPAWAIAGWALGVWGGVVGSVLLLLRKRLAAPVYLASLAGAVVSQVYTLFLAPGRATGASAAILPAVIVLVATGLWLDARALAKRGVLT